MRARRIQSERVAYNLIKRFNGRRNVVCFDAFMSCCDFSNLRKGPGASQMRVRQRCLITIAGLMLTTGLFAQARIPIEQAKPSPLELTQLPKYCWAQYSDTPLPAQQGFNITGCGPRMNHFCPALLAINRASEMSRSYEQRRSLANYAAREVQYTLSGIPGSCPILQDVRMAEMRVNFLLSILR